ncbi:MAG: hypothetical protein ACPL1K_01120 [Candidatus Kryptoniota bacterium]
MVLSGNDYVITGNKYVFPFGRQVWFLKYDENGSLLIEEKIGGNQDDSGEEIVNTPDGGYIIIGSTKSFGARDGESDVWFLKLNSFGDTLWTKTYNLGGEDMGKGIIPFQTNSLLPLVPAQEIVEHCCDKDLPHTL